MGPAAAFSMWGESTVAQPEPRLHTQEPSGLDLEPRCRHTWGEHLATFTLQRGPDHPQHRNRQQMLLLNAQYKALLISQKSSYFLSINFSIIFSWNCKTQLLETTGRLIDWLYGNWVAFCIPATVLTGSLWLGTKCITFKCHRLPSPATQPDVILLFPEMS